MVKSEEFVATLNYWLDSQKQYRRLIFLDSLLFFTESTKTRHVSRWLSNLPHLRAFFIFDKRILNLSVLS